MSENWRQSISASRMGNSTYLKAKSLDRMFFVQIAALQAAPRTGLRNTDMTTASTFVQEFGGSFLGDLEGFFNDEQLFADGAEFDLVDGWFEIDFAGECAGTVPIHGSSTDMFESAIRTGGSEEPTACPAKPSRSHRNSWSDF